MNHPKSRPSSRPLFIDGQRPTMSRSHFILIASVLAQNLAEATPAEEQRIKQIARDFATELADTNSSFQASKFLRACGLDP